MKPEDIVFDLGANFGMFTSYAAALGCEVYSFEPLGNAINSYLRYLNKFYPNIHLIEKAVSNKDGVSLLDVDNNNYGGSFINEKSGIEVNTITLDKFVEDNNIQRVDFIKADIEGSECDMLDGAKMVLKEFSPKISICKYHHLNDSVKIKKKILTTNPNYTLDTRWKKIYGEVK